MECYSILDRRFLCRQQQQQHKQVKRTSEANTVGSADSTSGPCHSRSSRLALQPSFDIQRTTATANNRSSSSSSTSMRRTQKVESARVRANFSPCACTTQCQPSTDPTTISSIRESNSPWLVLFCTFNAHFHTQSNVDRTNLSKKPRLVLTKCLVGQRPELVCWLAAATKKNKPKSSNNGTCKLQQRRSRLSVELTVPIVGWLVQCSPKKSGRATLVLCCNNNPYLNCSTDAAFAQLQVLSQEKTHIRAANLAATINLLQRRWQQKH